MSPFSFVISLFKPANGSNTGSLILIRPQRKLRLPRSKEGSVGKVGILNPGIGNGIGGINGRDGKAILIKGKLNAGMPGKGGSRQNNEKGGIPPNKGSGGITKVGSCGGANPGIEHLPASSF